MKYVYFYSGKYGNGDFVQGLATFAEPVNDDLFTAFVKSVESKLLQSVTIHVFNFLHSNP